MQSLLQQSLQHKLTSSLKETQEPSYLPKAKQSQETERQIKEFVVQLQQNTDAMKLFLEEVRR